MTARTLIYLFAIALIVMGISQYFTQNRSPEFEAALLTIDTQEIVKVEVIQAGDQGFTLLREGRRWLASKDNVHLSAKPSQISILLEALSSLQTELIVTADSKAWEGFALNKEKATQLKVYADNGEEEVFLLGKISLNDAQNRLETYVRLEGQKEIYAIDALPLATLSTQFEDYRPGVLLELSTPIIAAELFTQDSSFHWVWPVSAAGNSVQLDSLLTAQHLSSLQLIEGNQFADDIDELAAKQLLFVQLQLSTEASIYQLNCYQDTTLSSPFIFHSDQFPEVWLASDTNGLFRQVFAPWQEWLIPSDTIVAAEQLQD